MIAGPDGGGAALVGRVVDQGCPVSGVTGCGCCAGCVGVGDAPQPHAVVVGHPAVGADATGAAFVGRP